MLRKKERKKKGPDFNLQQKVASILETYFNPKKEKSEQKKREQIMEFLKICGLYVHSGFGRLVWYLNYILQTLL